MTEFEILPAPLVDHARLRGGVFTSHAARRFGLHQYAAAIRAGECHRVHQGLYSLEEELDAAGRVWAGLQLAGRGATLGLDAAAWVLGKGPEPEVVDVFCGTRNLKDRGPWRFHTGQPEEKQSTTAVNEAYGRLLLTPSFDRALAQKLAGRSLRLSDRERFLELCTASRAEGRSVFETRFNRDVTLAHGLPLLDWRPLPDGKDHLLAAALFGVDVNVRIDGSLPHRGLQPLHRWSRGELPDDPDAPLVLSWSDVEEDPCLVAGAVARRLRVRAWQGEVLDCSNCTTSTSSFSMMHGEDRRSVAQCPSCGSRLVQLWRMPEVREAVGR